MTETTEPTRGEGRRVMYWEPIETAPRDGTRILVTRREGFKAARKAK